MTLRAGWSAVTLLATMLFVPGCSEGGGQNACDTARAKALVNGARTSSLVSGVPSTWRPEAVYAECDQDDEFVAAGRRIATPDDGDVAAYLNAHGFQAGLDGEGHACRTIEIGGATFSVNAGGGFFELRHYLMGDNTCTAASPRPS